VYFLVERAQGGNWDNSRLRREQAGWEADSEADVRARLAEDPWQEDMFATKSIEPWTIFLHRSPG
jgi:hypothetical protein